MPPWWRVQGSGGSEADAKRGKVRRAGVEMLIWSSRLLLPVALLVHLLVAWSVAARGLLACLATLLAPGIAEAAWLAWLGWSSPAGRIVLFGCSAVAMLVLLLGLGMAAMSPRDPAWVGTREAP